MQLQFHTNLDDAKPDVNRLNVLRHDGMTVPRKGERLVFPFQYNNKTFSFDLEVVAVNYNYFAHLIVVELHIASPHRSIAEWIPWFRRFRYQKE